MPQRAAARREFPPAEVLGVLNAGLDGYSDPTTTKWNKWFSSTNCFSGAFSYIQRARFANVVSSVIGNWVNQSAAFTTLKFYATPTLSSYLIADIVGKLFSFDAGASYPRVQRFNPYYDPTGTGTADTTPAPSLVGPWSRETLQNILYEMNGAVKQSGRGANAATIEGFGIDAPDASLQVTITAGDSKALTNIQRLNNVVVATTAAAVAGFSNSTNPIINVVSVSDISFNGTFGQVQVSGAGPFTYTWPQAGNDTGLIAGSGNLTTQVTKSVGRSYAYAWENANKPHISAPSPSTQYVLYNAQYGGLSTQEPGTISNAGTTVTGTNTQFTSAWVGRSILVVGRSSAGAPFRIKSVASATSMTTVGDIGSSPGDRFVIYDPQSTHIRWYATADGGASYFRIARTTLNPAATSAFGQGVTYLDSANSEPPSFPFTSELSQLNNVPPPIGSFLAEYQGRLVVFGIPGADQSFFYSNQELTTLGMPQESFAPLNQYTLPIQNARLRGWIEMPGSAIIWSDRQDMFRLTGLLTDNTAATAPQLGAQITRLPYNLGCVNPYAAELTPLGAVWMTPQAEIWLYTDRYAPRNIGRPIQDALNSIGLAQLPLVRFKYYHNNTRNWLLVACATSGASANNTLFVLDLDLLASNGSPSFFVFDMATNQPTWYKFSLSCTALEVMYEPTNLVRLFTTGTDLVQDADFSNGFGTEVAVSGANVLLHPWGNDSATMIKRPTWLRFNTNRDPSVLAADGWSFKALGIDDDFYTLAFPLSLTLTPGLNDTSSLGGNPLLTAGSPFRTSPELFRIGSVNFVMGRRIQFQVNFPSAPGVNFQFRQIQVGFGPSPPR